MNKFAISTSLWAQVVVGLPSDLGEVIEVKFKAKFKRLKTSAQKDLHKKLAERSLTDPQVLEMVLEDWDLKDHEGSSIAFTPDNLKETVEDLPGVEQALVRSFFEYCLVPRKDAQAKNLLEPLSTS